MPRKSVEQDDGENVRSIGEFVSRSLPCGECRAGKVGNARVPLRCASTWTGRRAQLGCLGGIISHGRLRLFTHEGWDSLGFHHSLLLRKKINSWNREGGLKIGRFTSDRFAKGSFCAGVYLLASLSVIKAW